MRVTIVIIPAGKAAALEAAAKVMAAELGKQGHEVELLIGAKGETNRLAMSEYLVFGTEPVGLRGTLPPRVGEILAQATGLSGKRGMAFVLKRGPFRNKTLPRLMKAMEAQGMTVNYGEVVKNAAEAALAAREAPIERHR
jgi:hypothetical protein